MKMIGLVVLAFTLVLISIGVAPAQNKGEDKTAELIVGRWVPASGKEKGTFVEFTNDGAMTYTFGPKDTQTYTAKYRVINDKTLEVEFTEETLKKNEFLSKKAKKAQVSVTKDELVFDPTLTRAKKKWVRGK